MEYVFRLTEYQHQEIAQHCHLHPSLPPIAVCGRRTNETRTCLSLQSIIFPSPQVPLDNEFHQHLQESAKRNLVLLPLSPTNFDLRPDNIPHRTMRDFSPSPLLLHAVHKGDRDYSIYSEQGQPLTALTSITGDDIHFSCTYESTRSLTFVERHQQVFGGKTTSLLQHITAAVVGCSGTGSPVIEQLARLGIRRLILVDPERVEMKNLNRMLNATMDDVQNARHKVDVLATAIQRMGLSTQVVPITGDLSQPEVILQVAASDILFGCMDTAEGRHTLNRIATFYSIPYFDIGVGIKANGQGGISQAGGTVHYLTPGGSSLFSRGVYTLDQLHAESLRRTDPATYADHLRSGYVIGAQVDTPAVISVNMQLAAMAVNEFLARLHPYRSDPNATFASHRLSLKHGFTKPEEHPEPCPLLQKYVGRGDMDPLLDMPSLSIGDQFQ